MHKILKIKPRIFLNKKNKIRARYIALLSGACALGLLTYAVPVLQGNVLKASLKSIPASYMPSIALFNDTLPQADLNLQSGVSEGIRRASLALRKPPKPLFEEVSIRSGDTLAGVLQENGLNSDQSYSAVKVLSEYFDPRKIRAGQTIEMYFNRDGVEDRTFDKFVLRTDPITDVTVMRNTDNTESGQQFAAAIQREELLTKMRAHSAEVQNSLYGSAEKAGIPAKVVGNVIRTFSWNVDFQRDVKPGDTLDVMYETKETKDGRLIETGNIVFAKLNINGREMPIYRFEKSDGGVDYYGQDGHSLKKALMRTPIDGARMSSGFGMRRHPILGYSKMHKGVDFAAPTGTPIYAAGNGTIEFVGRKNGYGNYILLKHNGELKTAYAHMHRFSKGITNGKRVKQGDIIGYVGSTGRSTGPHLHYEILVKNQQVNPNGVNLPVGEQLAGTDLKRFKEHIRSLDRQYASLLRNSFKVAAASAARTHDDDKSAIQ